MIALLLILVPLISGIAAFFFKDEKQSKAWSLVIAFASLAVMSFSLLSADNTAGKTFSAEWLPQLGSSFALQMDGLSTVLCLLTGLAYPLIFVSTWKSKYASPNIFYCLML